MRRLLLIAVCTAVAFGIGTAYAAAMYTVNTDAHVRGAILFVGDSNEVRGAKEFVQTLTTRSDGYLPVFASRGGSAIRQSGCAPSVCGSTVDYWKVRLGQVLARVAPDAVVVNLGINDAATSGTCTTLGYSCYAQKINWLMGLLPHVPVLWTNLPCAIEPTDHRVGCGIINQAIAAAPARWPNLTILNWSSVATPHPEWMDPAAPVHYTDDGYAALASLVGTALDTRITP